MIPLISSPLAPSLAPISPISPAALGAADLAATVAGLLAVSLCLAPIALVWALAHLVLWLPPDAVTPASQPWDQPSAPRARAHETRPSDVSDAADWSNPPRWPKRPSDTMMTALSPNMASPLATLSNVAALPRLSANTPANTPASRNNSTRRRREGTPTERPTLPFYDLTHPEPDWPPQPRTPGVKTYRFVLASGELVRLSDLERFHALPPARSTQN